MILVSTEEMRDADKRCQEMGIPGIVLMENAGRALCHESLKLLFSYGKRSLFEDKGCAEYRPSYSRPKGILADIVVLCGPGQNGGDGFVAARHLSSLGHKVTCVLSGSPDRLPLEAKENYEMLKFYPVPVLSPEEFLNVAIKDQVQGQNESRNPDLVIDALLGTGTKGAPRAPISQLINWANSKRGQCYIVACDIPSGLNGNTGFAYDPCIQADLTVTMGLPKVGLFSYPGRKFCGRIVIESLGMPKKAYPKDVLAEATFIEDARNLMPRRDLDHHKGKSGHVTVIAGSLGMAGAAVLCAEASLRVGAGTTTLIVPGDVYQTAASSFPEIMVIPCDDESCFSPTEKTLRLVKKQVSVSSAVALGPGFGRGESQTNFLKEILPYLSKVPSVIDADGLFALKELGGLGYLSQMGGSFVLTPHPGEMSRLLDLSKEEIGKDRPGVARKAAVEGKAIICLKGAGTIVANPSSHVAINTSGTSAMATGGAGDVLTGVIAGLLAQGLEPFESAQLGVFWHGLSGEIAEREKGPLGITARDLLEYLPKAGQVILSSTPEGKTLLG